MYVCMLCMRVCVCVCGWVGAFMYVMCMCERFVCVCECVCVCVCVCVHTAEFACVFYNYIHTHVDLYMKKSAWSGQYLIRIQIICMYVCYAASMYVYINLSNIKNDTHTSICVHTTYTGIHLHKHTNINVSIKYTCTAYTYTTQTLMHTHTHIHKHNMCAIINK
jgi:hypothetical protein